MPLRLEMNALGRFTPMLIIVCNILVGMSSRDASGEAEPKGNYAIYFQITHMVQEN